jgi:hypothetical protein
MTTVAEMVISPQDEVVATGADVFRHNPVGSYSKAVHVGFLVTEPSQRGKGFAQLLLARIILACTQEYAAELLYTGVRPHKSISQWVCRNCGLDDSDMYFLGVSSPQLVKQGEFTR